MAGSSSRLVIDHCPVHPGTFLLSCQLKSPVMMMQSRFETVLSSSTSFLSMQDAYGFLSLYLCGTYIAIKNMQHIGPGILIHAIREPPHPELSTFGAILFDSMMATPAAGSVDFPFFSSFALSEVIQVFDPLNLFCLLCSSVRISAS